MTSGTFDPSIGARNFGKTGRLETDTFCHGCGYNLHGQIVTPDDRLGLMLCRCPECGRHHPAGFGTSAASVWLTRLGTILLFVWIAIVLGATLIAEIGLAAFQAGYVSTFLWYHWQPPVNGGAAFSPVNSSFYSLTPPAGTNATDIPGWGAAITQYFFAGLLGFFLGSMLVVMLWHWPVRRYALALLLPIISGAFLLLVPFNSHEYDQVRGWCLRGVGLMCGIEAAGLLLGAWLGRPLARVIVRAIVPPRPRQFLAFLWTVDGKPQPSAGSKSTSQLS